MIRERILGPAHPDTSYYIRYRGAVYADAGRFDRCIELWTYALTMQQSILEPLSPMTQSSLLSFAELFSFMLGEAGKPITRGRVVPPVDTGDMLMVFGKAVQEVKLGQKMQEHLPEAQRDGKAVSRALVGALHIACLLAKVLEEDDGEQAATTTAHAKGDNEVVELLLQVADVVPDTREEDTEHRGEGAKSVNAKAAKRMADREEVLKALYDLTRLKVSDLMHLQCFLSELGWFSEYINLCNPYKCTHKAVYESIYPWQNAPGYPQVRPHRTASGLLSRSGPRRPLSGLPVPVARARPSPAHRWRRSECARRGRQYAAASGRIGASVPRRTGASVARAWRPFGERLQTAFVYVRSHKL